MPIEVRSIIPKGGYIDQWLKYTEPFEYADSYAVFTLLAVAGAAVDRRIQVNPDTEPDPYTNMYVILFGPSGARKGTAIKYALRLLGNAVREVNIVPKAFTFERLVSRFAQESKDFQKCGGLVHSEEFQRLIGGRDYQADNMGFLTELWDSPGFYDRDTHAHAYEVFKGVYVCIMAALPTEGAFKLDPNVLDAGCLRRMLIVCEYKRKKRHHKPPVDQALAEALEIIFRERLGPDAFPAETKMVLTPEADEFMKHWYHTRLPELEIKASEREGHFVGCMQAHVLKVAALFSLLEGGDPTRLERYSFEVGTKLVEAIMPEMFKMYASLVPTPFARLRGSIMRTIATAGGETADTDLMRNVVKTVGAKPKEVIEALSSLINDGTIVAKEGTVKLV